MTSVSAASAPPITFGPMREGTERAVFDACPVTEPVSAVRCADYARARRTGHHRPEWTWLARHGQRIVARAVWGGDHDRRCPRRLECVTAVEDVDRVAVAAGLLAAAHRSFDCSDGDLPGYVLRLPGQWRRHEPVRRAVRWRLRAAGRGGLGRCDELVCHVWTPHVGLPAAPSDVRLVDTDRATLPWRDPSYDAACGGDVHGHRHWIARVRGEQVGAVVVDDDPARRGVRPIWFGVHPDWRGRGLGRDLLAAFTRHCAWSGADRIVARTSGEQRHVARWLTTLGYRTTESLLSLTPGPSHRDHHNCGVG